MTNTCTRCGSERILAKTWEETIVVSTHHSKLIHKQLVCPNPECQRQVEEQWAQQKEKREYAERQKEITKAEKLKENARVAAARAL